METSKRLDNYSYLVSLLTDLSEFLEPYVDVVDGSYGEYAPNKAMSLQQDISDAIYRLKRFDGPNGDSHILAHRERIMVLEKALQEIMKGEGAFSRDPLEHASNCIESMKQIASDALFATSVTGSKE